MSSGVYKNIARIIGIISAVFWSLINFQPSFAGDYPGGDEPAAPVSSPTLTLTLSIAGGTNVISLNIASLNGINGVFRTSDTTTNNISVSTNNFTGYTLGIMAKVANSNALINQSDNTKTLPSITTTVSQSNYADDTYAETNNLNNTWGYRPSTLYDSTNDTNVSNTDYLPAPTSAESANQTILAKTSTANTTNQTTGDLVPDPYNIAIGARIDESTSPGEYTNTFVITAVANNITYTVNYNQNTEDTVSNMPASSEQATVNTDDFTITLSNNKPVRSGYIFKGWCTVQVVDNAVCPNTANEYRPGTELPVDYTTNTITLYARWVDATLWNAVVDEWEIGGSRIQTNGTNTDTGIKAPITTSNSGVFKYNSTDFGTDTDAEKEGGGKYDIYYFRGILDSDLDGTANTYGSNGDGMLWPNYVILDTNGDGKDTADTCWRIVRTTASGGTKMIYNGKWTGSTCANATTSAQLTTSSFSQIFSNYSTNNIITTGYTFNNNYKTTETDTPYGELFGTNEDFSDNTTNSTIKNYIENIWFSSANGISDYESILESNAGYCNDRSMYDEQNVLINNNDNIVSPYTTSSSTIYRFGASIRDGTTPQRLPTLNCPRNIVDLYTFKTDNGVNLNGGNGQLSHPVALITADEARFAGSGSFTFGVSAHANSYLRSGSYFWSLSPNGRNYGHIYINTISSSGSSGGNVVKGSYGVRPAISLNPGISYTSGTGTAADPWVIPAPQNN